MPEQSFSLTEDQPPRFRLEWQPGFRDVHLFADGRLVSGPFDYAQLHVGRRVALERGHELFVWCNGNSLNMRLDGALLAGSDAYPAGQFRMAYRVMYLFGLLYLALGCVGWLFSSSSPLDVAAAGMVALLFWVLALLSSRKWMSAMLGGVTLLLADMGLNLLHQVQNDLPLNLGTLGALVVPGVGALVIFRGALALRELRNEPPELPPIAGSPSGASVSVPLAPRELE